MLKGTLIGITLATAALTLLAYYTGGLPAVLEGLTGAGGTALQALPLLLAAFVVIGQLQVLLSGETLKKWLAQNAGNRGIIYGAVAGGLFPGGPYVFYPFVAGFWKKKIPFYLLFSFVHGKMVYDFSRLPLEAGLIGPGIALLRNLITLPVPLVMGWLARRLPLDRIKGPSAEGGEYGAPIDNHF